MYGIVEKDSTKAYIVSDSNNTEYLTFKDKLSEDNLNIGDLVEFVSAKVYSDGKLVPMADFVQKRSSIIGLNLKKTVE